MHAHIRIRILLLVAVAVICGAVFAVTEMQRRSSAAAFGEYAAVRELRGAATQLALAYDEAATRGVRASAEVEVAGGAFVRAVVAVRSRPDGQEAAEIRLVERQVRAGTALNRLAGEALRSGHTRDARRDALLDRFLAANDELLEELAEERQVADSSAARRPVVLVLGLSLVFGLLHVWLVERPASGQRRRRITQREFSDAMQVARSEPEAYDVLARHVQRACDAVQVTVLNRNSSANRLQAVTPVAPDSATALGLQDAAPDSCLAIRLARTHHRTVGDQPLLTCDVCGRSAEQTTCVPSLVGGEVVGAVLVEHHRQLAGERRTAIEHSVAEAAPVVANLRNLAIAELRAATDGLTGLPNQRSVHETLKRMAAHAGRTASPLALVLFDLDRFKEINDTYGHSKGDEVLAAVGAITVGTLRASDFVGRLGGEEFAALLPDTDRAGGIEAAEKLRAAIATISVPGVDRYITASFGVAVMPDDAGEPDFLLRLADRALYAAKSAGRDRVETIDGSATLTDP